MARLFVMCGLQGSGKSSKAKQLIKEKCLLDGIIVSSDEIRKEMPDANNDKVFKILYKRVNQALKDGKDVIVDATNITMKSRKSLLNNITEDCLKCCYIMNTPYEICLERVRNRNKNPDSHYVPEDVVEKYYHSFEIPFAEEGWHQIEFDYYPRLGTSYMYLKSLLDKSQTFNQNNKHHTQLLGEHMETVAKCLQKINAPALLIEAGKYHDVGKLFTQTYKDGDPNAHYYDHANVGTYNLMCFSGIYSNSFQLHSLDKTLKWLFYINYHMKMHNIKTEKSKKKWERIFGSNNFYYLDVFNKADCFRGDVEEFKVELIPNIFPF